MGEIDDRTLGPKSDQSKATRSNSPDSQVYKSSPGDSNESSKTSQERGKYINSLNVCVFVAYFMSSASVAVPVALITTVSNDLMAEGDSAASFSARVAAWAVAGTSLGKAINGFVGDSCGARRTMAFSFIFQALALFLFSIGNDATSIGVANFLLEYFNSVHWPCQTIVLSVHYRGDKEKLEAGVMVLGLSSRAGALLGIPLFSLLNGSLGWRSVALWGMVIPLFGFVVVMVFISDAPSKRFDPQGKGLSFRGILDSLREVLSSKLFWLIAFAQSGNSLVRTSERILGGFFSETAGVDDDKAGGLTAVLSGGLLAGVLIFGGIFIKRNWEEKRKLVMWLYVGCGFGTLMLGVISLPMVADRFGDSVKLGMELALVFFYAMCVGVQYYNIPSLLASTFGENKGLCSAYIDGVAYICTSFFWTGFSRIVNSGDYGWFCGWGLLIVIIVGASLSMDRFMVKFWAERWGVETKGDSEAEKMLLPEEGKTAV
ncbi:hypothetical protein TrCOL_g13310 [Triparma columacea]|uniref:Major facilitator superfamily (MFS) profile domain-containing protein n=1 Tax=Triparma columacea TaxID=722753 RepID=A0A9W7GJ94_9STRA|nr:hypothetical protein TrCOL_g13310 [Triparma columacea]